MRYLSLLIAALILSGCVHKPKSVAKPDLCADTYAIVNLVLSKAVMSDTLYRNITVDRAAMMARFPPVKFTPKQKEQIQQAVSLSRDSMRRVLDTAKLYMQLSDRLIRFPTKQLSSIRNSKNVDYNDTSLIRHIALAIDTDAKAIAVQRNRIKPLKGYKLLLVGKRTQLMRGPGIYTISNVCFDRVKTMACVYVENYCGSLCGEGALIFLSKRNGQWVIVARRSLWVA